MEIKCLVYGKILIICVFFLIDFFVWFVDVEMIGSLNEFYDKFSIRYYIFIIMKSLW